MFALKRQSVAAIYLVAIALVLLVVIQTSAVDAYLRFTNNQNLQRSAKQQAPSKRFHPGLIYGADTYGEGEGLHGMHEEDVGY